MGSIDTAVMLETQVIANNAPTYIQNNINFLTPDTHEITKGGYYDGKGVELSNTDDKVFALFINTSERVIIANLNIVSSKNGIAYGRVSDNDNVAHTNADLLLINSTIKAPNRGIQVWYQSKDVNSDNKIVLKNVNLVNTSVTDYETEVANSTMGLICTMLDDSYIEFDNVNCLGFGYSILLNNAGSTSVNNTNNTININNSTMNGRACIDALNTFDTTLSVSNSNIHCINIYTGPTEVFGNIVIESGNNNKLNLTNNEFSIYRSPATGNNTQYAVMISSDNNVVTMSKNTMIANIYYTLDSKLPSTTDELNPIIYFSNIYKNTLVGNFEKSQYVCHQGSNTLSFDWFNLQSIEPFRYFATNLSFDDLYSVSDFQRAVGSWFMNGEEMELMNNLVVLRDTIEMAGMKEGQSFKYNFKDYKINIENGAKILIPKGVTIYTDSKTSKLDLFAAVDGCKLEEKVDSNGNYYYVCISSNQ